MTIEKIKGYEEPFKKNDKYGDYERAPFEFYKGDIPIIVTAPHTTKTINLKSGREKANDRGMQQEYLPAGDCTGSSQNTL